MIISQTKISVKIIKDNYNFVFIKRIKLYSTSRTVVEFNDFKIWTLVEKREREN